MSEELDGLFETLENDLLSKYQYNLLLNYITNLQKENTGLKKLCDKYEEEHKTTFETWEKVIVRNKKAIEYIEKYLYEHVIDDLPDEESKFETEDGMPIPNAKEVLLNILKGSDEE